MLFDGAGNHLVETEPRIALLTVFLVQHIATLVVGAPPLNGALQFGLGHGLVGDHVIVVKHEIVNTAAETAEIKTGTGFQPGLGGFEKWFAIVLGGRVAVVIKAVTAKDAFLILVNAAAVVYDFKDTPVGRDPPVRPLVPVSKVGFGGAHIHDVVGMQVVVGESEHLLVDQESHHDLEKGRSGFVVGEALDKQVVQGMLALF